MVKNTPSPTTISGQLRQAIQDSGRSLNALSKEAGMNVGMLSRFMSDDKNVHRDLRLKTVDKLAAVLGLRLIRSTKDA